MKDAGIVSEPRDRNELQDDLTHSRVQCLIPECEELLTTQKQLGLHLCSYHGVTAKIVQGATHLVGSSVATIQHRDRYRTVLPTIRKSRRQPVTDSKSWPPPPSESWFGLMLLVRKAVECTELECFFDVPVHGMVWNSYVDTVTLLM